MDYSNYKKSRDLAWEFLIQHHVSTLPIPVAHLAKEAGIHCMPYELGQPLLEDLGLWEHCCTQSDGFAVHVGQNGVLALVLYNDKQTRQRCRFTIAHEMGHIFCRNLSNKYPPERKEVYSLINREPSEEDEEEEREANVFASRLLAPACVLHALHVQTAEQIAKLCDISITSAQFRMERMRQLYEREQRFLSEKGVSCFCLSPLERQVRGQFQAYIRSKS